MKRKILLIWIILISCKINNYTVENLKNTKEELLREAFESVFTNDSKEMDKIILNRKEHNEMFWNHVGERFTSDPGMTPDLAYDHMSLETRIAWKELVKDLHNKKMEFQKVECGSPTENYGPFTLVRGCVSFLKNLETNEIIENRKIRNLIQYNGKFKIYNMKRD